MLKEGDVFNWENSNKAVIVKVLDESSGLYNCVYHQNNLKYVVSEFHFFEGKWEISEESGREIKSSEWAQYINKLK